MRGAYHVDVQITRLTPNGRSSLVSREAGIHRENRADYAGMRSTSLLVIGQQPTPHTHQLPGDDLQRLGVRAHDELLLALDGLGVVAQSLGQLHLDRSPSGHHLNTRRGVVRCGIIGEPERWEANAPRAPRSSDVDHTQQQRQQRQQQRQRQRKNVIVRFRNVLEERRS